MGIVARLRLDSFRNYEHLDIELSEGINLFIGRNGQGKTNILEAISYLALLRSFRGHQAVALRKWGADVFSVGATLCNVERNHPCKVSLKTNDILPITIMVSYGERRVLKINHSLVNKASDFINQFICVSLAPEDIGLIKGTARIRRKFLDIAMTQANPTYIKQLQNYLEALHCRNAMLRNPAKYPPSALTAYEEQLAKYGAHIELSRRIFVKSLSEELSLLVSGPLEETTELGISYVSSIENGDCAGSVLEMKECFHKSLAKCRDRDHRDGHTGIGPHRSDMKCTIVGKSLSTYGSEGQCRLMSLLLRLASLRVIRREESAARGIVFLVDDVMGELDPLRRQAILGIISEADQVLLTTTEMSDELHLRASRVYEVNEGMLRAL